MFWGVISKYQYPLDEKWNNNGVGNIRNRFFFNINLLINVKNTAWIILGNFSGVKISTIFKFKKSRYLWILFSFPETFVKNFFCEIFWLFFFLRQTLKKVSPLLPYFVTLLSPPSILINQRDEISAKICNYDRSFSQSNNPSIASSQLDCEID